MSTKNNVLHRLEANRGKTLSGEQLAESLCVSRAAVWKAIKELQRDGYLIHAVTKKGYQLADSNDILSPESIGIHLPMQDANDTIQVYPSLPSTNQTAKQLALSGAKSGTVVIANEQTSGRGRMGRAFFSPADSGIYMSVILRPRLTADKAGWLATAASVAVCRAVEQTMGLQLGIKWVNDLFYEGKKVCGILTEASTDFETGTVDWVVLGIGINVTTKREQFPQELQEIAGGLLPQKDGMVTRSQLIAQILQALYETLEHPDSTAFIEEYKRRSLVLGKEIQIMGTHPITAKAMDIDEKGGLVVQFANGQITSLTSGEVCITGDDLYA